MNERQRLEELNDLARGAYRAEIEHAAAVDREEAADVQLRAACEARRTAETGRAKAWAIFQTAFVAFVQDARRVDPARASTIGEVLAWFTPRRERYAATTDVQLLPRDPDDRPILQTDPRD